MNNSGTNPKRDNKSEEETDWGGIFGAVATGVTLGAGIVGGIYVLSKAFGDPEEKQVSNSGRSSPPLRDRFSTRDYYSTPMLPSPPRREQFVSPNQTLPSPCWHEPKSIQLPTSSLQIESYSYSDSEPEPEAFVSSTPAPTIVIDATPIKCGGLVRFPTEKRIYVYSALWKPYYQFSEPEQEPDKFEMVNALVALTKFPDALEEMFLGYNNLIVKTDNTFYKATYKRNEADKELLDEIRNKMTKMSGEWEHCIKGQDNDMKMADRLSRGGYDEKFLKEYYPEYEIIRLDVAETLKSIRHIVPYKYHSE